MRTYFSLFLCLCLAVVSFSACKKSSDDKSNPNPVYPPTTIVASRITMNNVNTSAAPSGTTIYSAHIDMYGNGVLLARSYDIGLNMLPYTEFFNGTSSFSYATFKDYDLKYYGVDAFGQDHYLGMVHIALKDYSSDTYPQPTSMFFNSGGFAGTLEVGYVQ